MIPKTEMDAKEYDPGSTKPEGFMGHFGIPKTGGFVGHFGIPKTEMDTEESDDGSYTSCSFLDGEEMEDVYNDFYFKDHMIGEDYDIQNHPMCFCGRLAKKRLSMTAKNPNILFFNCAKKNFNTQCGYFQWCDELYGDKSGIDNEQDEYETDDEEVDSNHVENEGEKMVSSEEKSMLTRQVSTASIQVDQFKLMDLFPQYPDLALLVQEHKPQIGLDGSILSLAPPVGVPV